MTLEIEKCIRCGTPLESEEDLEFGICADCWTDEDEEPRTVEEARALRELHEALREDGASDRRNGIE